LILSKSSADGLPPAHGNGIKLASVVPIEARITATKK
jgi:hypothetical protein